MTLEPGWPAPDVMGHVDWPDGEYFLKRERKRYVWRTPKKLT